MRKPSSTRNVFAASRAGVGGALGSLPLTALRGGTMRESSAAAKRLATEKIKTTASPHRSLCENARADSEFIYESIRLLQRVGHEFEQAFRGWIVRQTETLVEFRVVGLAGSEAFGRNAGAFQGGLKALCLCAS